MVIELETKILEILTECSVSTVHAYAPQQILYGLDTPGRIWFIVKKVANMTAFYLQQSTICATILDFIFTKYEIFQEMLIPTNIFIGITNFLTMISKIKT